MKTAGRHDPPATSFYATLITPASLSRRDFHRLPIAHPRATLHIVEFVLRGGAVRSADVVGDFNEWRRGATPLHRDANGTWRTRALVPRDALRYAYVIDDARIISPPPLTVVRDATRMRHDSI